MDHGALLHRTGRNLRALECFARALRKDPVNGDIVEAIENIRSFAVERWHFRMLNDTLRNKVYFNAIQRTVQVRGICACIGVPRGP